MRLATLAGSVLAHAVGLAVVAPLLHRDQLAVPALDERPAAEPIEVEVVTLAPVLRADGGDAPAGSTSGPPRERFAATPATTGAPTAE